MIQTVYCKNCGNDKIQFKLRWTYDQTYCKQCHNIIEHDKDFYFCSWKCVKEFAEKIDGHKCEDCLKGSLGSEFEGKNYSIKTCEICETQYNFIDGELVTTQSRRIKNGML